jgi:GWxTD domain-containing protein
MKRVLLVAAMMGVLVSAQAQQRRSSMASPLQSGLVGIVHAYPAGTADSSVCILGYQLDASELVFVQQRQTPPLFVAQFTVTVELRDSIGVVRFATVFRDTVSQTQAPQRYLNTIPAANVVLTTLANGRYTMSVDVMQQQRQRMLWQREISIGGSPTSIAAASLVFLTTPPASGDDYCAYLWGHTVPYGTRRTTAQLIVPRQWSGRDKLEAICRLYQQYYRFYQGSDTAVTVPVAINPQATFALPHWSLESEANPRWLCMRLGPNDQYRTVSMELDLRRAIPGDYELLIIRPTTRDTVRATFRVYWFAAPPHLFVSRYAVDVMHYVLTDQDYTRLLETPDSNRTAAIIAWWAQHDPTPATRYNEAMVEYFRRAYAARTKLATAQEPDGALSERGKIYILFGEPTRIETALDPDKPGVEIWHYTNAVRKRFTFEVTDQGRYRLVKIDAL